MLRGFGADGTAEAPSTRMQTFVKWGVILFAAYVIFRPEEERGPGWRLHL